MSETHIVCTTDFAAESKRAFYHALALALAKRGRLTLLHVGTESRDQVPWQRFPSVRDTLVKWGLLEPDPAREAVNRLIKVRKKAMRDEDPVFGIIDFLNVHRVDLLVLIARRPGRWRPFRRTPTALRILRAAAADLLLLPDGGAGLVDPSSGRLQLRQVLLPIGGERDVAASISLIGTLLRRLTAERLSVTLLQIGNPSQQVSLRLPTKLDIEWHQVAREGRTTEVILAEAERIDADLIVMSSAGRSRIGGRLRNARVEQVLQRARRPLLAVAAE